jgi:hypothetical protein
MHCRFLNAASCVQDNVRLQNAVDNLAELAPDVVSRPGMSQTNWDGISTLVNSLFGFWGCSKAIPNSTSVSSMGRASTYGCTERPQPLVTLRAARMLQFLVATATCSCNESSTLSDLTIVTLFAQPQPPRMREMKRMRTMMRPPYGVLTVRLLWCSVRCKKSRHSGMSRRCMSVKYVALTTGPQGSC